jgi:hypothetical protein
LFENLLLERFSALDVCKFAATGFVSSSLLCAEKGVPTFFPPKSPLRIWRAEVAPEAPCYALTGERLALSPTLSVHHLFIEGISAFEPGHLHNLGS